MYGIAAIQQANGWVMAGAGACIVISGLAILAFLISLIPQFIGLFDRKPKPSVAPVEEKKNTPKVIVPERLPDDVVAASAIYIALTEGLGEEFTLINLHLKTKELGLPHPHLSINRFREAGILIPLGDGRFSWQPAAE
jgi:Na+-transporting methylmalonyl-CoA/oxaloacetate decarboxylase gamma subunit